MTHKQHNSITAQSWYRRKKTTKVLEHHAAAVSKGSKAKARRRRVQASLVKHKVTLALVWSSPSSDVCDKRVIRLEMNWVRKKGPCKSGERCLSLCNRAPFSLGLTRLRLDNPRCLMKSTPRQTAQVHSTAHSAQRDCCSLWRYELLLYWDPGECFSTCKACLWEKSRSLCGTLMPPYMARCHEPPKPRLHGHDEVE